MDHEIYIKECFKLSLQGLGNVAPNPLVGAVLVNQEGNIVAKGAHLKYGQSHAEVNCINSYNGDFSNLTLYVNLEPCSHSGKTPPCTDLIIKKGIKRVVYSMSDPNKLVSGKKTLKNVGIEVIDGVLEDEAKDLNRVFIKNITQKKPFIATKIATTLDGKIATYSLSSKWITSDLSREEVQKLRASFVAIMTGSGTVLADNPSMNCRNKLNSPIRIIFDKSSKIPKNAKVFSNDVKVYHITDFDNFDSLFKNLYNEGIYSILIEAGRGLNSALIKAGEIDYLYQFIAPKIIGSGISYADDIIFDDINCAYKIDNLKIKQIGQDVLLSGKFVYN